jgi:hypothetical protein
LPPASSTPWGAGIRRLDDAACARSLGDGLGDAQILQPIVRGDKRISRKRG